MSGEGQIAGEGVGGSTVEGPPSESQSEQYSLAKILGIWAAAALPMGLILWVITPFLIPRVDLNPGLLYISLITLGLVWLGVLSYIILRREVVPFTWEGLKERLWLNTPRDPRTGRPSKKLFLWTIPVIAFLYCGMNSAYLKGLTKPG
jgi:hypothetical protein